MKHRASLVVLVFACLLAPSLAQAQVKPAADVAYAEVITWAMGYQSVAEAKKQRANYGDVHLRLERAASRFGIRLEFAMAVVAAESSLAPTISHARSESWRIYQESTNYKMREYPHVLADLDTALSSLGVAMERNGNFRAVLKDYWCGPSGAQNKDSLDTFITVVTRLWNGLEPYARTRDQQQLNQKFTPSKGAGDYSDYFDDLPGWSSGRAEPNKDGFKSSLGPRPLSHKELVYFEGHEEDYTKQVKRFNKNLSDSEAKLIARSILTYCHKTNWKVDPRFVMALVAAESAFRPNAVSKAGAMGLGQLMPATARGLGISKPFDVCQNLYGCVKYIEREQHRWGQGKMDLILAAYNAGPGAVKKYGGIPPYRETQGYVKTVRKYYAQFVRGT